MILKYFLALAAFVVVTGTLPAVAQEAAPSPNDDGPITILDQVVPVAEEYPRDMNPPEVSEADLSDRNELLAEFERYKELNAAGVYDEAENAAKRVVEMSIQRYGPTSNDTAKALSNLGLVQHHMKNFDAAQQNFQSAIDIISDNEDKLSDMLINPLKGLGAAQLQSDRPDLASRTYERAMHVSHVNDGPHNAGQIEILEALAEANLRLGHPEDAKHNQDTIYSLNLRHYSHDSAAIIRSLSRRAVWQRRTGYVNDERATYRRIIRIIEDQHSKDHISLIEPLKRLGQSYFYFDTSTNNQYQSATIASGEMYFKRAVRIAEENPESNWQTLASAKLSLGDYYNIKDDQGRARSTYRGVWKMLSQDDERFAARRDALENLTVLNENSIPRYVAGATRDDVRVGDAGLREGRIVVSYDISSRGRVSSLKIVEAEPVDFESMQRSVIRAIRARIYRIRFIDANPAGTPDQVFTHTFYYQQDELDELRESRAAERK